MRQGDFTLPGEAGCESLTLELAKRWGADVIRDSDGTTLSEELLEAGYRVYSTVCVIREHNEWIASHPQARQQTFLCTSPRIAKGDTLRVPLLADFFAEQFEVNDGADALPYWQVYDRTTNVELPRDMWSFDAQSGEVVIKAKPYRAYTVSFLAWRVWEEISMYNHVTNGWDKPHLMQLNPYGADARQYLLQSMDRWLEARPKTDVVRYTSLFYNFAWIWGGDPRNRNLFTDWASYDFTVCPLALRDFEREYGYALTAEDFTRGGLYNATHIPPDRHKLDWMAFIGRFVRGLAKELVALTHKRGKQAYVFYDDSWVGMEPYGGHFQDIGFDGIIKCVFSGFEVRLCGGVKTPTHELRFHPYLFPVGLGGAPTFMEGGRPERDAMSYWLHVRRALLRQKIERAGLGGYLHLTEGYPDFLSAMDTIMSEFRRINDLHKGGAPATLKPVLGVLTAWGSLRSWTLSGHFHETDSHPLIHLLESLSGMPYEVRFLSFEDVIARGGLDGVSVLFNAGKAGTAWSGGDNWRDAEVADRLTRWVCEGGVFIGIREPSACEGFCRAWRMADVLGVDIDDARYSCHGCRQFEIADDAGLCLDGIGMNDAPKVRLIDGNTRVLRADNGAPVITERRVGAGMGVYIADYEYSERATWALQALISRFTGDKPEGVSDNALVECAVFEGAAELALINQSAEPQACSVRWRGREYSAALEPLELKTLPLQAAR